MAARSSASRRSAPARWRGAHHRMARISSASSTTTAAPPSATSKSNTWSSAGSPPARPRPDDVVRPGRSYYDLRVDYGGELAISSDSALEENVRALRIRGKPCDVL